MSIALYLVYVEEIFGGGGQHQPSPKGDEASGSFTQVQGKRKKNTKGSMNIDAIPSERDV